MKPIRVMIVDDHAVVIEGIERILKVDGRAEVICRAKSLREAKIALARLNPDVLLLDLRLPDSQGVATVAAISACCPRSRLIVLTSSGRETEAEARKAGADAFLQKETASDEIVATIARFFPEIESNRPRSPLTPREADVARLAGEGMTNAEIAKSLYISEDTVHTHMAHILNKLGLRRRGDLIRHGPVATRNEGASGDNREPPRP